MCDYFKSEDKLLEAQRIAERTNFDIEMLRETGFCSAVLRTIRDIWQDWKPGHAALHADGLFSG